MVRKKDTSECQKKQAKKVLKIKGDRVLLITAETPFGICSERLSAFGGLQILVKFLDLLKVKDVFNRTFVNPMRKPALGSYRMLLGILIMLFVGYQRLHHIASLQTDPLIAGILRVSRLPVVSTFWRYLGSLGEKQAVSILYLMQSLRRRVWHCLGYAPQRIRVNIDTTVSTVYGDLEQAHKGYNTRHRGKKGYRPVLCFIHETREYLCGGQRTGKTLNKKESGHYIRQIRKLLPSGIRHVLISGDAEFLGWASIAECQKGGYRYIFANKRCRPEFPPGGWYSYKGTDYNECRHHPSGWQDACRFVVMRIPLPEEDHMLFPELKYSYRIFITNRTTRPHNVIKEYDKRADVENSIKEAQSEGIMAIPSKKFARNQAFFQITMLAYNIWRWIKLLAVGKQSPGKEVTSDMIRRHPEHQQTIRLSRLDKLYIPAKLTHHNNRANLLYSQYDVRSAGVIDFLKYLDARRREPTSWPQMEDTG